VLGAVDVTPCTIVLVVPDEALQFTTHKCFPIDHLLDVLHIWIGTHASFVHKVWATTPHTSTTRLGLSELLNDLGEIVLARGQLRGAILQRLTHLVLATQVAEVAILQLVVLVSVQVGEDLNHNVSLESHLQIVQHVCEVSKSDKSTVTLIEGLECG